MRLPDVTLVIPVPGVEPKSTAVAPVKLVPLTVTVLPPAAGPLFGLTPVTVGAGLKVNESAGELAAEVPLGVVTVTSTVPVPAGEVTVRLAAVTLVRPVPRVEPKCDGRGPGEIGAGHRDRGPAGCGPVGRAEPGDRR